MAQMKEQIKAPEKIQLSDEEIANLSDAQFKKLVIRMLTELIELSQNEGTKEGYPKWEKAKYTRNQQWQEGNQDSNQWFGSEGRKKHLTTTEWRNKNKSEERLRNLQDIFRHSNIQIIGVPEGEEEEQEIENLFEQIRKENFPIWQRK